MRPAASFRIALLSSLLVASSSDALAAAPQAEARALLERWLDDQNQGDFVDYQKLYGDDFVGVRRSGSRSVTLDRAGWLQDRQRMFRKKMTVEATNVRIFASQATARIVFVQRWSSGGYSDVGPKHLILRRGLATYSIQREELFASDRRKPGAFDLTRFNQLAFVIDGEVVVSMDPDEAWGSGPAELEKRDADKYLILTRRRVDKTKLPPDVAALVGGAVRLMDRRGVRCEAKLGELLLRGRVWTPETDDAEEAWAMSARTLVAKVDGDRKACAGATWARSASLPAPLVAPAEAAPDALKRRGLAAFRALPEVQAIQRRFNDWHQGTHANDRKPPPSWFTYKKQDLLVRLIRTTSAGPTLLSVSATINEGSCGHGVLGSLWALWQVEGSPDDPRLILRNQPNDAMTLRPTAAVDVNGDGRMEILFERFADFAAANASGQPQILEHGIVRALGDAYVDIDGPETPILMCPC